MRAAMTQSVDIRLAQAVFEDAVLPFQIESLDVRGRVARLSPTLTEILSAHQYPAPVADVLAQALVMAGLLGSLLKGEGQLTLQAKSNGPISLLVVDYALPGAVRGYAQFNAEAVAAVSLDATLEQMFGQGYLALTMDQGTPPERYQGIVELKGVSLADCMQSYFESSDQLPSLVHLAVRYDGLDQRWIGGGLLIQHLPKSEEGGPRLFVEGRNAENWRHAQILAATLHADELTDPSVSLETLLWRLFHEDGVRVFDRVALRRGCRCSRERIQSVLRQFSFNELMDMREPDGSIRVNCAFCSKDWVFERPQERQDGR
jgi:molecular chaperone Hsp33